MELPSFIVIGPGRAGSTWIYEVLRAHPEIFLANGTKETFFFDREFARGVEWYTKFYKDSEKFRAVGEVTNTYIYDERVPARMKSIVPNIDLITCLRNPIERIQSVYFYRKQTGIISESFSEAIKLYPDLILDNRYWTLLSRFLDQFEREQLHILFFDDLSSKPREFVNMLYRKLGVDPNYVPDILNKEINVGAKPRIPGSGSIFKSLAEILRSAGLHVFLDRLKRNDLLRWLILKPLSRQEKQIITFEQNAALLDIFKPEIEKLEEYTGRDLSNWMKMN